MFVNVSDLRGPYADQAAEIVAHALSMTEDGARALVQLWDDPAEDQAQYLKNCARVWDALEESSRLLPLGWFERAFRDSEWFQTVPRALHAVADAVSVTLVRDLVSEDVVRNLLGAYAASATAA